MQHLRKEENWWDNIRTTGDSVVKKAKFGTAMDPLLVLTVLVLIPCLVIFAYTHFWPILIVGFIPPLYSLRAYDYFMKNNPNMLRTEKHEEIMLQLAATMGHNGKVISEAKFDALPSVPAVKISSQNKPKLLASVRNGGKRE